MSSLPSAKVVEIKRISKTKSKWKGARKRGRKGRKRTLAHRPTAALQLACNVPPLLCHSCGKHPSIRSLWGWANTTAGKISLSMHTATAPPHTPREHGEEKFPIARPTQCLPVFSRWRLYETLRIIFHAWFIEKKRW